MKKLFLILFILPLLFPKTGVSQTLISKGMPSYITLDLHPNAEIMPMTGELGIMAGLGGDIIFNNKWIVGGYLTKKVNKTSFQSTSYNNYNVVFEQLGGNLGVKFNLGVRKDKSGVYVKRKTKLVLNLNGGFGRVFLKSPENSETTSSTDLFVCVKPKLGLEFPVTEAFKIGVGAQYQQTILISSVLDNKDVSGFGGYVSLHFILFTNRFGAAYIMK